MSPALNRRAYLFALVPFLLLALNLRPALTAVGPLVADIQATTGLSGAAVGFLNSLPLLAFSAFAPLAQFGRRLGIERTLVAAMLLLGVGIAVRSTGSIGALFLGTVMLGAGIAVGNVLAPSLIKRDYPDRVKAMTTVYAVVLTLSAAIASGVAVPFAGALASGWQGALAVWAIPAVIAAAAWLPGAVRSSPVADGQASSADAAKPMWRSPMAWFITGFMGLQSLGFYVAVAWLPSVFQSNGHDLAEAGLLITVFQLVSLGGSAALPLLIGRSGGQSVIAAISSLGMAVGAAGMIVLPQWAMVWIVIMGAGSGACFPLALAFIGLRTTNHREAASLSLMAQSLGYLLAASGPVLLGLLHDITDSWTLPLLSMALLAMAQGVFGYLGGRNRTVFA